MQKAHTYPSHRAPRPPILWRARPDADLNAAPLPTLPHAIARTRAIREIFLRDFHGCARLDDVGEVVEDAGLLESLSTAASMRTTVKNALRPICLPKGAGPTPGLPPFRPRSG